jgi:hypothetical protein
MWLNKYKNYLNTLLNISLVLDKPDRHLCLCYTSVQKFVWPFCDTNSATTYNSMIMSYLTGSLVLDKACTLSFVTVQPMISYANLRTTRKKCP